MISIKIQTENASFSDSFSKAVNHALLQVQEAANNLDDNEGIGFPLEKSIFDLNGNKIGHVKFTK